jgi:glycosyltransferase involved in cell wall biosynthesis
MKLLFITNLPSPYRVDFFNELGKYCELTVCFERHSASDRDTRWRAEETLNFRAIYTKARPVAVDKSIGSDIVKIIKCSVFDNIIVSGYSSPSVALALIYCRCHNIPYYIESDGAFYKKDKLLSGVLKKYLLGGAVGHFTSCDEHIRYLNNSLGISKEKIHKYPFTSLKNDDVLECLPLPSEKQDLRKKLCVTEEKMVIGVGQFIQRKGWDVLMEAAVKIPSNIGVYIIGGVPSDEYVSYKKSHQINHLHFIDFMDKESLKEWYKSADCFVMPTRFDIWGLVINEAMAAGLPVITTNKCIAGLELVSDNQNGFIISIDDSVVLAEKIKYVLQKNNSVKMGIESLKKIRNYTIERMVEKHLLVLKEEE